MTLLDQVLWAIAFALTVAAFYLSRPKPRAWQPALLYRAILGEEELRRWEPSDWLGPGMDWKKLGEGGPELGAILKRRLGDFRLLWFGAGAVELPGLTLHSLEEGSLGTSPEQQAWEKELEQQVGKGKVILAASGKAAMGLLRLLHEAPGLRDRCHAVLLVEPDLEMGWIQANFTHTALDTELNRVTPYLVLRVDRSPPTLVTPPEPPTGRVAVEVLDLAGPPGLPVALLLAAMLA
jgi:hypothetical protein